MDSHHDEHSSSKQSPHSFLHKETISNSLALTTCQSPFVLD